MVVIKAVELNLKKRECTSGSDCGLYYKRKTHTPTFIHTQLLILKLRLRALKRSPQNVSLSFYGSEQHVGLSSTELRRHFNINTEQAAKI